jgi:DNA-binding PadR family transcriptional regulator
MADQSPNDQKAAATIPAIRITIQMYVVLAALLNEPGRERWGFELAGVTGRSPGTIYPILARLGEAGIVLDRREDVAPGTDRPPRRYWRLNPAQPDVVGEMVTKQAARYRKRSPARQRLQQGCGKKMKEMADETPAERKARLAAEARRGAVDSALAGQLEDARILAAVAEWIANTPDDE